MDFRQIRIPYEGRDKYPSNANGRAIARNIINEYFGGGTGGGYGGDENRGGNSSAFYAYLSKNSSVFSALELASTALTENIAIYGYRNMEQAQVLVGNVNNSAATGTYDIQGIPDSGMSINVLNQGTTGTSLMITVDGSISSDSGTLTIPVAVNINDNTLDPYHYVWNENLNRVVIVNLTWSWKIDRSTTGGYLLDLSNERAGVNVSATTAQGDIIFPNSISALTCTATTHLGTELVQGVTYSVFTQPRFNARGNFGIGTNTGVMYWESNFNFDGPSLPIDIIASLSGNPVATKTMTIDKNYPGADGSAAVTRWIVTSADQVKHDPNTNTTTPSAITAHVMKQVGGDEPIADPDGTQMYYWNSSYATPWPYDGSSVEINPNNDYYAFGLKNSSDVFYEIETIPILWEGTNGTDGTNGTNGTNGEDGKSAWYMTMSNDNATINCDSEGNILPNAVRPQTNKVNIYYGTTKRTDATYKISANTSYTGVTSANTSGELSIVFNSNFAFTGDVLNLTISGTSSGEVRDVKVMSITKCYAGASGEPATTYWLDFNSTSIIYNPNNNTITPSNGITVMGWKQTGGNLPEPVKRNLVSELIRWCWVYPDGSTTSTSVVPTSSGTAIPVSVSDCTTYKQMKVQILVGQSVRDTEYIDIIREGLDGGSAGQGRTGAAIRGPYDYYAMSSSTQCWCAGESSNTCSDCDKWIDVILKDGVYYYCNTTYYGKLSPWNTYKSYWTSGDSFNFVASNLILASAASINFLTNNELYLRDSNNQITGGAAGGSGITFWAGAESPSNANFAVDANGNITAKTGTFSGYIQYPYSFVSDLTKKNTSYKIWDAYRPSSQLIWVVCDSWTGSAYCGDRTAYLVSDATNEPTGTPAYFCLPTPSSAWNGFTYEIIVEPSLVSMTDGSAQLIMFVSGTGVNSDTQHSIVSYAFSEQHSGIVVLLHGGKFSITCLPGHGSYLNVGYYWAITNATGHIDFTNGRVNSDGTNPRTETTSVSSLLAYSTQDVNPIYKLLTYTGDTPSVLNSSQTMFIKK